MKNAVISYMIERYKQVDDCWEWQAALDRDGYGLTHGRAKKYYGGRAHRVMYELYYGAIPDGMVVMHLCDNRCCVNPNHLTVGTQADNVIDMMTKGRHRAVGHGKGGWPKGVERCLICYGRKDRCKHN